MVSSALMLGAFFAFAPDRAAWLSADELTRVVWLAAAVAGGGCVYLLGLLLLGERPRYVLHRV